MTKALFSVNIEALIICRKLHDRIALHETPSPRENDNAVGFDFTTNGVLCVINEVKSYNPH